MTHKETGMVLAVLKAAYPHSFKDITPEEGMAMANLWQTMFAADPYEAVNAAVSALISTRKEGYSPTIGEVKEQLYKLTAPEELNEGEAWAMICKACKNGSYGYKEEFEKLPPEVQKAVGKPEQIREWAQIDTDTFQTVIMSNFQRSFRIAQMRAKQDAMLPPGVRETVGRISGHMAYQLPEGVYE